MKSADEHDIRKEVDAVQYCEHIQSQVKKARQKAVSKQQVRAVGLAVWLL